MSDAIEPELVPLPSAPEPVRPVTSRNRRPASSIS